MGVTPSQKLQSIIQELHKLRASDESDAKIAERARYLNNRLAEVAVADPNLSKAVHDAVIQHNKQARRAAAKLRTLRAA
jgi:hypothetical protein